MNDLKKKIKTLEKTAYDPYERIAHPTTEDWKKSYDALKELCELKPDESAYPNTLGYLCYYGRHTGGNRQYEEAREWFEQGNKLYNIESAYKLADMLTDGLGGPVDRERALRLYLHMYLYCRDQFEGGMKNSKFADTALRMGRTEASIPVISPMPHWPVVTPLQYAGTPTPTGVTAPRPVTTIRFLLIVKPCGTPERRYGHQSRATTRERRRNRPCAL